MWKYRILCLLGLVSAMALLMDGTPTVKADVPILNEEEQDEVNRAIDRGVKYLLKTQNDDGSWGTSYHVGYTSMSGLALIECGVPPKDIQLQKAAYYVRKQAEKLGHTYQLSLAILFLDALGDPRDKVYIQTFAMRLICGQTQSGGWGYSCPVLTPAMNQQMFALLREMGGGGETSDKTKKTTTKAKKIFIPPAVAELYPVLQDPDRLAWTDTKERSTCNSNTHFAILALWAARRHNMPLERSMNMLVQRFRKSQNGDGGWGYAFKGGSSPAMTCVGLLGMAIGYGLGIDNGPKDKDNKAADKKITVEESRYRVPKTWCIKTAEGLPPEPIVKMEKPEEQTMLVKGFNFTMKHIGQPVNRMKDIPMGNLYHMWALERVSVLFGLRHIGDRDWYRWGAEMLVANQDPLSGAWEKESPGFHGSSPILNTGIALLFLKRANLASDLTRKLPFDPSELSTQIKKTESPPPPPKPTEEAKAPPPPAPVKPEPAAPVFNPPPAPVAAAAIKKEEGNGMMIALVIGGISLLLLVAGGVGAFLYLNKGDEEEEEKKPKKKKKADSSKNGDSKPEKKKKSSSA